MKIQHIVTLLIGSILGACSSQNSHESTSVAADNIAKEMTANCYTYVNNRDTVELNLMQLGTKVSGELTYKLYEKDANRGTIEGEIKGDTLLANYTFKSEGISSLRQVAFLKKGEDWVEGIGDVVGIDGRVNFKDPKALHFHNSLVLKKGTCKSLK
ncbi:hypothetical protein [Runella slithyformis]|uniref:Lipoprotein n=1 Tax=Runella slithyformis (strain ATCC 29530 / DSM 19594 / LMG 11500 / NCIMB 11436 / LSU 4) TaxID=761193 RepID=A0A7U3ZP98_RUNSL|nr:hypothetical protein [Runella slithyformis]AEI50854.1 hypothetical protein Runsl_4532 [Runella slithyformis DSM 19594]